MEKYERWAHLYKIDYVMLIEEEKAKLIVKHNGLIGEIVEFITVNHSVNAFNCGKSLRNYLRGVLLQRMYKSIVKHEKEKYIKTLPRIKQKLLKR